MGNKMGISWLTWAMPARPRLNLRGLLPKIVWPRINPSLLQNLILKSQVRMANLRARIIFQGRVLASLFKSQTTKPKIWDLGPRKSLPSVTTQLRTKCPTTSLFDAATFYGMTAAKSLTTNQTYSSPSGAVWKTFLANSTKPHKSKKQ